MKAKSITARYTWIPSSVPSPVITASPCELFRSACASRSRYGFRSTNSSGSPERRLRSCSRKLPSSVKSATYPLAESRRWCAHCGHTFQFSLSFSRYRISPHEGHFSHTFAGRSRRSAACRGVFGLRNQAMDRNPGWWGGLHRRASAAIRCTIAMARTFTRRKDPP